MQCDVVVIGAGIAGLNCATALKKAGAKVKLVEAHPMVGGRMRHYKGFVPWNLNPLGAEFVHGNASSLYSFLKDNNIRTRRIYTWAQGDGAMSSEKVAGGCGMYYFGKSNETVRTDEIKNRKEFADIMRVNELLENIDEAKFPEDRATFSLKDYLKSQGCSSRAIALAEAGFANTLCSSVDGLNMRELVELEKIWDETEGEGDYRVEVSFQAVLDRLAEPLKADTLLCAPVSAVKSKGAGVEVSIADGRLIHCKRAVVTTPVSVLKDGDILFSPPLSTQKLQAAKIVPFHGGMKILLRFKDRFWPEDVHGCICADAFVPEVWFDGRQRVGEVVIDGPSLEECTGPINGSEYTCTGFACAEAAKRIGGMAQGEAVRALLQQLDCMFGNKNAPNPASSSVAGWLVFDWSKDPYIRGAYSSPGHLAGRPARLALAAPEMDGKLLFAGEATNTSYMSIHGAWDSGVRAAEQALTSMSSSKSRL